MSERTRATMGLDGADGTPEIDPRTFRNVLGQFTTGITVITTLNPDRTPIGFACQSFAALSLEPPLVLFCPTKQSRSWAAIEQAGKFCVNVLAEKQREVCARFGSREQDKFAGVEWHLSELELPVIDGSLATIECLVDQVIDGGDHYIAIGRVQTLSEPRDAAQQSTTDHRPLLFYRGQYTAIEPAKTTPAPWRADLDHFLTTTTLDTWL